MRDQMGRDRQLYQVMAAAQNAGSRRVVEFINKLEENSQ